MPKLKLESTATEVLVRGVLAAGLTLCVLLLSSPVLTRAPSPAAPQQRSDSSFDAALDQVEAAQVKLVNGQPDAFKALWSHSDDVTLSGGLGGAIAKGWKQVSERLDWVATQYVDGARTHQEVSRYVGQDLAYVVLRETIRFKRPTDRREMVQELRVTQIFRKEGGRWRIVHRHADSETAKQTNQAAGR